MISCIFPRNIMFELANVPKRPTPDPSRRGTPWIGTSFGVRGMFYRNSTAWSSDFGTWTRHLFGWAGNWPVRLWFAAFFAAELDEPQLGENFSLQGRVRSRLPPSASSALRLRRRNRSPSDASDVWFRRPSDGV